MSQKIKIGIIGGSGLDDPEILDNKVERSIDTPYGLPSDVVLEGTINGIPCALLARHGRQHNITPHQVNYRANIWALRSVGCTHVLASTACGSLQEDIPPGTFVILDDFIDRTNGREQSFYDGRETSPVGVCHLPMYPPFCGRLRDVLARSCLALGVPARLQGTCVTVQGPRFSSRAESNIFRSWGGSVINMTTVPEVVLAKEAGLCYAAIAMATDYDCWRDTGAKVCVADVLATFKRNVGTVKEVLLKAVELVALEDWSDTIKELQDTVRDSVMLPH